MKKIFTLLCTVLFSVQFAAAQQPLYVCSKSGDLAAYTVNKVTFDNDIFVFTGGSAHEITKESFYTTFYVDFKSTDYKSFSQAPEVGICFSDVNENLTVADGTIKYDYNSSLSWHYYTITGYDFSIKGLDAGTTYYYRAYVRVNDVVCYGDVKKVTTLGKKSTTDYKIINGHKFVDLGLPSGLLWATCNVGAAIAANDGNYYAWGETSTKSTYDSNNYFVFKTYSINGKTTLEKQHDAAYVNWGSSCRMPTKDEFGELLNSEYCTWTWTSMTASNGSSINGYKVTSVKNGNSIFLPASSCSYRGDLSGHGSYGNYWSSTLRSNNSAYACSLHFYSSFHNNAGGPRWYGYTVRPVAEP